MGYDYQWELQDPDGDDIGDGYFRLNIFGGRRYADAMVQLGMAFHADGGGRPAFPSPADYDLTDEQAWETWEEDLGQLPEDTRARRAAYDQAWEQVLRWHGPEIPGIPAHKIAGSNDGWHVLPVEITPALRTYRTHSREHVLAVLAQCGIAGQDAVRYWDDWIDYLQGAAERGGGFRTN